MKLQPSSKKGKKIHNEAQFLSSNFYYILYSISILYDLYIYIYLYLSVYIKRIQKVGYCFFFSVKNTPKLINQQFKNEVKIVNWKKKVSYCLFYCQKYPYLKLKNEVKIVN